MKQSRVVSVAVAVTASFGLLLTAAPAAYAQDPASAPTQKPARQGAEEGGPQRPPGRGMRRT